MRRLMRARFLVLLMLLALLLGCSDAGEFRGAQTPQDGQDDMQLTEQRTRVTVLDVGKGDCILIETGSSSVLIDTGYRDTAGEVLSCLADRGIGRLDALVITHYDKDHIGGLRAVAEALDVDVTYLPGYEGADKNYDATMKVVDELDLASRPVTDEVVCELGEARLTIYPAGVDYVPGSRGDEGNDNDASLVVALRCGDDSYLFAGDLEEEGIDAYLQAGVGSSDVLKMPHHGEKADNIDELLDDVQPQIALITDGASDPADKKTLKALKKHDVDTYQTSVDGTIVVESDGTGSYEVTTDSD